jgi:hypothetical protein
LTVRADGFKGWIGQLHADPKRGGFGCGGRSGGEQEEEKAHAARGIRGAIRVNHSVFARP